MAISNNSTGLRPGVCTSSTRPTAPYEGQQIYETDTDLTYVWGGSAWQQVSGGTAVGNSGLVYITQLTLPANTTSVTISNCFSSTYDAYKIIWTGGTSSGGANIAAVLGSVSTGYYMGQQTVTFAGGTAVIGQSNTSSWGYVAVTQSDYATLNIELYNPNKPTGTGFSSMAANSVYGAHFNSGWNSSTLQHTAITFSGGTNLQNGIMTVYGYRK